MACTNLATNLTAIVPPPRIAPAAPDFFQCSRAYGILDDFPVAQSCGSELPQGCVPIDYSIHTTRDPYYLPFNLTCNTISIFAELSPSISISMLPYYQIAPDDIRGMAGWILSECVQSQETGGFVTKGFRRLVDFNADPKANIDVIPLPPQTVYLTLSIMSEPHRVSTPPSPGDLDSEPISHILSKVLEQIDAVPDIEDSRLLARRALRLGRVKRDLIYQLIDPRVEHRMPWWEFLRRQLGLEEASGSIADVADGDLDEIATF